MYTIAKEFSFDASHILQGLPEGHKCGRMHGHTYTVIVQLACKSVDGNGFVQDYNDLDDIKRYIDNNLDHRHLNDVLKIQPSAENIARYLFDLFKEEYPLLKAVSVKETPKTIARYEP